MMHKVKEIAIEIVGEGWVHTQREKTLIAISGDLDLVEFSKRILGKMYTELQASIKP